MLPISDFKINAHKKSKLNLIGKIKVKLLVVFALVIAALFFTQLVFASNLAVDGQKIAQVDKEIQALEAENTTLKVQVAKESSLTSLAQKAKDLGYTIPKNIINPQ